MVGSSKNKIEITFDLNRHFDKTLPSHDHKKNGNNKFWIFLKSINSPFSGWKKILGNILNKLLQFYVNIKAKFITVFNLEKSSFLNVEVPAYTFKIAVILSFLLLTIFSIYVYNFYKNVGLNRIGVIQVPYMNNLTNREQKFGITNPQNESSISLASDVLGETTFSSNPKSEKVQGYSYYYSKSLDITIHYPSDWSIEEVLTPVDCSNGLEIVSKYLTRLKQIPCVDGINASKIVIDTNIERFKKGDEVQNYELIIASNMEVANSCGDGRMVDIEKQIKGTNAVIRGCLKNRVVVDGLGIFLDSTGLKSHWKHLLVRWTAETPEMQIEYTKILNNIE